MKKVLIFIDWFLPGYKAGGPIRSVANLTEQLSDSFEFFIITRNTDYLETSPYPTVKSNQWQQIAPNINVYYFSKDKLSVKNIKSVIKKLNFDTVYINGIYSFYFSLLPVYLFKNSNKKIVIASRGMLSKHSFSSKKLKKKVFIGAAQIINFYQNTFFHVTNIDEKNEIADLKFKIKDFIIAPNLPPKFSGDKINRLKEKGTVKLISIARISKEKGSIEALKILNKNKFNGTILFDLYGSVYQKDYWNQCLQLIKKAPENIKISYKGVLDNTKIPETIKNYHFSFLPTLGENFGHSILESMSFSCPVIISDKTPWRNLEKEKAGWDIPLNNAEKFAQTIQKCIDMEQNEYNEWSNGAYYYAKSFSENPELIEQSKKIFTI